MITYIYIYIYILCCMLILLLNKKKTRKKRRLSSTKSIKLLSLFFVYRIAKEHDSIFDFFFLFIFVFFFVFQNKHHLVSLRFLLAHTPVCVCQRTISQFVLVIINFFSFFFLFFFFCSFFFFVHISVRE